MPRELEVFSAVMYHTAGWAAMVVTVLEGGEFGGARNARDIQKG
jgi:hypothetical protein